MEDSEITRLAIEEILRETSDKNLCNNKNRKECSIGKPNKEFLGRTLNSVMTHNRREDKRIRKNCRKKLHELDKRTRKKKKRNRSPYISSSDESAGKYIYKRKRSRHTKELKHQRKYRERLTSSPNTTLALSSMGNANSLEHNENFHYNIPYCTDYYLHSTAFTSTYLNMQNQLNIYLNTMESHRQTSIITNSPHVSVSSISMSSTSEDDNEFSAIRENICKKRRSIDLSSDDSQCTSKKILTIDVTSDCDDNDKTNERSELGHSQNNIICLDTDNESVQTISSTPVFQRKNSPDQISVFNIVDSSSCQSESDHINVP